MGSTQHQQEVTWTYMNHKFGGLTNQGYAICENCGAAENSDEICEPCPKGPLQEFGSKRIAELEQELAFALKQRDEWIDKHTELEIALGRIEAICSDHGWTTPGGVIGRVKQLRGKLTQSARWLHQAQSRLAEAEAWIHALPCECDQEYSTAICGRCGWIAKHGLAAGKGGDDG